MAGNLYEVVAQLLQLYVAAQTRSILLAESAQCCSTSLLQNVLKDLLEIFLLAS